MANIFSRLFGGFSPTFEQPPMRTGGFVVSLNGKTKVLNEDYLDWYKTNPFVFTAINERAKAVSLAKFYIKTPEGEYIENDLTAKLNKPNQYLTRNEFIMQLLTYKGIFGTGYIYPNQFRPSDTIDKIDFLNIPTDMVVFGDRGYNNFNYDFLMDLLRKQNPDDNIKIYYAGVEGLFKKELDKSRLLPLFDTTVFTNPYYSESKLRSLKYVVSNIQAALESENTFLSTPGGIGMLIPDGKDAVGSPLPLDEDEKIKLSKQLQEDYGSLTGQANIRILNAPIKWQETMVDVSKLKLSETIIRNALTLFGAYGLPKELLTAMMTGSTFENQRTAYKNYIQSTAQTEIDAITNAIDTLYPSAEGELVGSFAHLPIMQEDEKERAQVNRTYSETLRNEKQVYDDWLERGLITEQQYKEHFKL